MNSNQLFFFYYISNKMDGKPKREMTEQQLENLKKGREKARMLKIQSKEITNDKKQTKKQEKEIKQRKLQEEYEAFLKKKQTPLQPQKQEEEEQEQEEIEEKVPTPPPPPKITKAKAKSIPPPTPQPPSSPPIQKQPRARPPPKPRQPKERSNDELYGEASIEILKKRLQQETRQRLMNDIFNY